jgi:antitoxin HicB
MAQALKPAEYLQRPYGRVVIPEGDGSFRAEIIEFPGCIAIGSTAAEALANLEEVAATWLEVTIAKGQRVPDPIDNVAFSGKLVVRLPKSLHKKAANMAARDGVSLNQFIVSSIAEQVGDRSRAINFGPFQAIAGTQGMARFAFYAGANQAVTQSSTPPSLVQPSGQLVALTSAGGGLDLGWAPALSWAPALAAPRRENARG